MISNTYVIGLDSFVEKTYGEAMRLSPKQREAIKMVRDGRVQYGAAYPNMARRGHIDRYVFLVDGHEVTGAQGRTFECLEEREVITVRHDLIELHRVPESTKVYHVINGDKTVVHPAHDEPVDPGWRTAVEPAKAKVNA